MCLGADRLGKAASLPEISANLSRAELNSLLTFTESAAILQVVKRRKTMKARVIGIPSKWLQYRPLRIVVGSSHFSHPKCEIFLDKSAKRGNTLSGQTEKPLSVGKNGKTIGAGLGNQNGKANEGKRYNTVSEPTCRDATLDSAMTRALDSVSMGGPYSPAVEAEAERIVGFTARLADVNDALDPEPDPDLAEIEVLYAAVCAEVDREPTAAELAAIENAA